MESPNKLCAFCDNFQKYICPKCRKAYCSLNCYKSEQHLECTENFYKDQVFEVLKQNYVDINDRKTMLEILKRVESAQPTETPNEDADIILEEKLENLNLEEDIDENELWNCLTERKTNAEEAISQTLSLLTAEDSEWKVKREDALEYTKEITKILQGPTESHPVDHILSALSDLKAW
ncbi:ZNHIT2 [Cordylochernes scorpioides]|uniref:ZNHIT2 n=1 Tax=Cordylochernes scorpioides TaxID=51811 RepID=A0ABY6KC26_9ARAC|nr:ZNHIT2 [Cordylochernes scorpioides]